LLQEKKTTEGVNLAGRREPRHLAVDIERALQLHVLPHLHRVFDLVGVLFQMCQVFGKNFANLKQGRQTHPQALLQLQVHGHDVFLF
jgi:hypothetical protein